MNKRTNRSASETDRAPDGRPAAQGVAKADLIPADLRDAARQNGPRRITAIGVARGPGDVADNVDRDLAETGFGRD
jgi:hypothetical protein